jgi:hypothetical protein
MRSLNRAAAALVCCAGTVVCASSSFALGGAVLLTQQRSVDVHVQAVTGQDIHKEAPDFGPFDETAEGSLVEPIEEGGEVGLVFGDARARQTSTLTPSLLTVSASLHAHSSDEIGGSGPNDGRTLFDVAFRLDQPHDFALMLLLDTESKDGADDFTFTASLSRTDVPQDLFSINESDLRGGDPERQLEGVLPAGTYRMFFSSLIGTSNSSEFFGPSEMKLALTPTNTAVPLPSALSTGMLMLIGLAAVSRLRSLWWAPRQLVR